jgi:hypothetical protein
MRLLVIAVLGVLTSAPAYAGTDADVLTCASVKDGAERLACYDAIAKLVATRATTFPENYLLQRFKAKKPD